MNNLLESPIRRCRPSEDIVPFSECRNKLSAMIERTRKTHRPILITQNGRAASYLVDAERFDNLIDRVELSRSIAISRMQFENGECLSEEDSFAECERMLDELDAKEDGR